MEKQAYDILIVGGGIVGTALARALSFYRVRIALLEARRDFARSTSGANSGIIHAGYDAQPGTLMAALNVKGCAMYPALCKDLSIPFRKIGSLVLAFDQEDLNTLRVLLERGEQNGVRGLQVLSQEALRKMEPAVSAVGALYAPEAGVISPYEAAVAFAENAAENGADIYLSHEVRAICREPGGLFTVEAGGTEPDCSTKLFTARLVVNCAGLSAGQINRMAGAEPVAETYRKGEYILYDKIYGNFVRSVIFQPPTKAGKGVLVTPTAEGNLLIGPSSDPVTERTVNTTAAGMADILQKARKSCPELPSGGSITAFAGIRPVVGSDFIIRGSDVLPGFLYTAGICSPGLTAAPAIAEMLTNLIDAQLPLQPKSRPVLTRRGIPDFAAMDWQQRSRLAEEDRHFAKIICRCETVTEGQILMAIRSAALFRYAQPDVDWVKRRCRAGLGRCQGGFCRPYVEELIRKYASGGARENMQRRNQSDYDENLGV